MTTYAETNLSLRQVLGQTWALLRKHPGLWNPPLVLNLLIALLATNGAKGLAIIVPMIGAWLLSIAFRAGWFEQMARVVQAGDPGDEPAKAATWGHFLEGVGRYFWRFLGGEVAQLVLLGLALYLAVSLGAQSVGWPDQAMVNEVMAAARQSGDALQKLPAATLQTLNAWTWIFLAWTAFWGVVAVGLLFWQTFAVWSNRTWPQAWWASLKTVGRHAGFVIVLAAAQALSYLLVQQLLVSGPGLLMMLGYIGYLVVWTVFSLALFLVLQRWEPHAVTPSDDS